MVTLIVFGILVVWGAIKLLNIGVRAIALGLYKILGINEKTNNKPKVTEEAQASSSFFFVIITRVIMKGDDQYEII